MTLAAQTKISSKSRSTYENGFRVSFIYVEMARRFPPPPRMGDGSKEQTGDGLLFFETMENCVCRFGGCYGMCEVVS